MLLKEVNNTFKLEMLRDEDEEKYLVLSDLMQSFIEKDVLFDKIKQEQNGRISRNRDDNFLKSIMSFIHHSVKFENIGNLKFNRSAKEIWDSRICSGCTDFALLFAVFARQLGIATTLLHTASLDWINKQKITQTQMHIGHTFCECFYENKWILVDPTTRKIVGDYNVQKIELPYRVLDSNIFIPYKREVLPNKQTLREHCKEMDLFVKIL